MKSRKDNSSRLTSFKTAGEAILPVLGLLGALLSAPHTASANSGTTFLETIGISIAVGTVLGASTLPFYDQPGKHLNNVAYGASLGAVTAVGISLYGLIAGSSQEYEEASSKQLPLRKFTQVQNTRRLSADSGSSGPIGVPLYPPRFWMPVVSLTW